MGPIPFVGGCSRRAHRGRRRGRARGHRRVVRETLATLWNTFSFFTTYASLNEFEPHDPDIPDVASRSAIDHWILSRAESVTETVTQALDGYEPLGGAAALAALIDDLSNWYVRRSRRRFWRTDPRAPKSDSLAAQATLLDVLQRVTLLLAPFCPLITERLYQELYAVSDNDSVHLVDWPLAQPERRNGPSRTPWTSRDA